MAGTEAPYLPQANDPRTEEPPYGLMLGVTERSPQYGLLGEVAGRTVAIDLNDTHTTSLFDAVLEKMRAKLEANVEQKGFVVLNWADGGWATSSRRSRSRCRTTCGR